jgi:hypothetical protein
VDSQRGRFASVCALDSSRPGGSNFDGLASPSRNRQIGQRLASYGARDLESAISSAYRASSDQSTIFDIQVLVGNLLGLGCSVVQPGTHDRVEYGAGHKFRRFDMPANCIGSHDQPFFDFVQHCDRRKRVICVQSSCAHAVQLVSIQCHFR